MLLPSKYINLLIIIYWILCYGVNLWKTCRSNIYRKSEKRLDELKSKAVQLLRIFSYIYINYSVIYFVVINYSVKNLFRWIEDYSDMINTKVMNYCVKMNTEVLWLLAMVNISILFPVSLGIFHKLLITTYHFHYNSAFFK